MDKKIENNPSYQKLKKELKGAEAISKIAKFFSFFGMKNKDIDEALSALPEMRNQLELLIKSPDKFNEYFRERGWIAHESMNSDLILTCIELADNGLIEAAEQELISYYSSENIMRLLPQLKSINAFYIRYKFLLLAYEDTIAERYHSVVPILLMMIDGAVNDIDKNKGFFTENVNLTAWDSVAAHSSGLTTLKEIFNDSRKKTNTDGITLPFRNGILHGRDLGFANKMVAAKCWAALFAIKDWADAVHKGKRNPPHPEPKPTFRESLSQLKSALDDYSRSKKKNEIINKKIESWKARQIKIGIDVPAKGLSTEYEDFTPEQEAIKFAEYWTKNNFGNIAKQINHFSAVSTNEKKEASKVRKSFEGKKLIDYSITQIKDCSPAITEVTLFLLIENKGKHHEKNVTLRFIYKDQHNKMLIFGDKGGQWKFIENFFYQIEYIY